MANYIMKVFCAITFLSFTFFAGLTVSAMDSEPTLVALPNEYYCWYEDGVELAVENSVSGETYTLQKLTPPNTWDDVETVVGDGNTIYFPDIWDSGRYRLTYNVEEEVIVVRVNLFPAYTVSGGGGFCEGEPTDHYIYLSNSQENIDYTVILDDNIEMQTKSGTGEALEFGPFNTPGTYTIRATTVNGGCVRNMTGNAQIIEYSNPSVEITAVPDAVPDCGLVSFSPDNPQGNAPFDYSWDFGNEGSTEENPSHLFPAYGNGEEDFNVTLTITDVNGCSFETTETITVMQRPDARLSGHPDYEQVFNNMISNCDNASPTNPTFSIGVYYNPTEITNNTHYSIVSNPGNITIWDEDYPPTIQEPALFTYEELNVYELTFTVTDENGCVDTKYYEVLNIGNPSGAINNPGTTSGCLPVTFEFPITHVENNHHLTTYTIQWGDNNESFFNHPIPTSVSYTYETTSCTPPGDNGQFETILIIENACATHTSFAGSVRIWDMPQPSFEPADGPTGCVDIPITFNNTTESGYYGSNCNDNIWAFWDFGDGNTTDPENHPYPYPGATHIFDEPGLYTVTLNIRNNCNPTGVYDQQDFLICIEDNLAADFEILNETTGCAPFEVSVNNFSEENSICGNNNYTWSVSFDNTECPTSDGNWSFINNTGLNSVTPTFLFNSPGEYTIRMRLDNDCVTNSIHEETITVKGPPILSDLGFEPEGCAPFSINPSVTYQSCYAPLDPNADFIWNFPGGNPDNSNSHEPGEIEFLNSGSFTISVSASNECGVSNELAGELEIAPAIENNIISSISDEICAGMYPKEIIAGTEPTGGDGSYEYEWYIDIGDGWELLDDEDGQDLDYGFPHSPLEVGTVSFMRKVISGGCEDESAPFELTVTPGIDDNFIVNDNEQHICVGTVPDEIEGSEPSGGGGPGSYSYLWEQSVDEGVTWQDALDLNDSENYSPPPLGETTWFRRIVVSGDCESFTDPVIVNVYGDITNNNIDASDDQVCDGDDHAELTGDLPSQMGNTEFTYQWQQSTDGSSFENIDGADDIDYLPGTLNETTWFRRIATSGAPAGCNIHISNEAEIIVNENPIATASADDYEIFWGTTTTLRGTALEGIPDYNWEWQGPVANSNQQNTETNQLFDATTFTLIVTDDKNCQGSDEVTVTVKGEPLDVEVTADPDIICNGESVTLTAIASGGDEDAGYEYTWSSVPPGNYPNEDVITVNPVVTTEYTVTVSDGTNTPVVASVPVTVNQIPEIGSPNADFTCSGEALGYQITSDIPGTTYIWDVVDLSDGDITGWQEANDWGPGPINDVLINSSDEQKQIEYHITPRGPDPTHCIGEPFVLTVTVNPEFSNTYINQNINVGTSVQLTGEVSGGTPGYNYSWQPANMISGPTNIQNPTTDNIFDDEMVFTLTVTDAESCQYTVNVTVDTGGELLDVDLSTDDDIVCDGTEITLRATASGGVGNNVPENYTYNWSGLPPGYSPINDWTVSFVPQTLGNNTYSVTVEDGNSLPATDDIPIIVNEIPEVTSAVSDVICSGGIFLYNPTANVPGTTFSWSSTNNTGGCVTGNAANGSGNINNTLINTCNTVQIITYTITPQGPGPTDCLGVDHIVEVSVNPVPSVTNPVNTQTVVSGQQADAIEFTSNVAGTQFVWSSDVQCTDSNVNYEQHSGSGAIIPAQTVTIEDGGPNTCSIIYTIETFYDGCPGGTFEYTIVVNMAPTTFIVSGGGTVCHGESTTVTLDGSEFGINYQLLRNGNLLPGTTIPGNGDVLTWTGISQTGEYTVMGTNVNSGVSEMMLGSADVDVRPTPQPFTLHTLAPGNNCAPVTPWLNGSQPNVIYQLNRTDPGGAYHPNIQEKTGTGHPLTFNAQENPGTYTVLAIIEHGNVICNREMLGSVIADPMPLQFDILPQGIICEDNEEICIESSETGIVYQLWLNDQFVQGTQEIGDGNQLCFGTLTAPGTYKIHAKNPITGCELFFTETIQVQPLPNVYSMQPAAGCKGTEIILNGCQDGIDYYLFFEPAGDTKEFIVIDGPVNCNGSETLNFGQHFNEGTYRIKAINPQTNCSVWMDNTTIIHPSPEAFNISPQGGTCPEATIILSNFQYGATYYLYRNGEIVASTNVINNSVSFEPQSTPGIYTVKAKFTYDNGIECWTNMLGSLEIYPLPGVYSLVPQGEICPPATLSLNDSDNGTKYTLIHDQSGEIQSITSTGGPINFAPQSSSGTYWIEASNSQGCNATMLNTATVLNKPNQYTITPSPGQWCLDEPLVMGLSDSDTGVTYELHRTGAANNPQQSKPGQNGAISFEPVNIPGTYRVRAVNDDTGCRHWMFGEIILDNLPIVYNLTADGLAADGFYCPGMEIGISGSVEGILYDLIHDDEVIGTITGTGTPIIFGTYWDIGEYRAKARDISTNCNSDMNGTINLYEHPNVFQLVSNNLPFFCIGDDNAITLTLSYAHESTEYQLYKDHSPVPIPIGAPKPGNNNSLSWENISAHGEGDYFAIGRFIADPNCWAPMDGIITTTEVPTPTAQISGSVSICEGQSTGIEFEITGFEGHHIRVIYSANGTTQPERVFDANGSHIVTVSPTTTTVYQVESVEYVEFPHCIGTVSGGSVEVTVNHLPVANAGADTAICELGFHVLQDASASNHGSIFWEIIEGSGEIIQNNIEKPTYWHFLANDEPVTNTVLQMSVFGEGTCAAYISTSTVTIQIDPLPQADAGSGAVICQNETLEMQEAVAFNYSQILWEVVSGNGVIVSPTHVNAGYMPDASDAGHTVVLMLTAFGEGMCDFAINQSLKTIEVKELPILSLNINGELLMAGETYSYCHDELVEISLANISSGQPPFEVHLQVGGHSETTLASVNDVIFSENLDPGIYPIELSFIMDQNGCHSSDYSDYQALLVIYDQLVAGTATASQTICYGDIPDPIMAEEPSGGSGTFEYQWEEFDNNAMDWTIIAGENNLEHQPPPLSETTRYRLRQSDLHCAELHTVYTNEVIIDVLDELVAGTAGDDQIICMGVVPQPLEATQPSGGSAQYLYQWEVLNEETDSWEPVEGETDLTIVLPALFETTSYRLRQTDKFCDPPQSATTNITVITVQPGPEAFAGPDAIICENETFTLNQAQASNFKELKWAAMGADGSFDVLDTTNPTYTPGANDIANGVVTLCFTAYPMNPCDTSVTDCMTLTIHLLPQIAVGDPLPTCVSENILVPEGHVTINHVGNIEWQIKNPTGGGLILHENSLTPTYIPINGNNPFLSDAGKTVVLEATATGQNGCGDNDVVEELEIKVGAIPETWFTVIDNQVDTTRCDNDYVYFRDLTSFGLFTPHPDQVISRRFWEFENNNGYYETFEADNDIIVEHHFGTDGLFTVRLTVETTIDDITINSITATQQIFIHKSPDANFEANQVSHCEYKMQFENLSIAYNAYINSWLWEFGDNNLSMGTNPIFEFSTPGNKNVALTVLDNRGCLGSIEKTITVAPTFDFEISYDPFCFGQETVFYIPSESIEPDGNYITSYIWTFSHTSNQIFAPVAGHTYETPGIYVVSLNATDATGCNKTQSIQFTVPALPKPLFTVADCNLNVLFRLAPGLNDGSIETWIWDFGDGTVETLETNIHPAEFYHEYSQHGIYKASLTVIDTLGCEGYYILNEIQTVCIEELTFLVPNAFAPGDGEGDNQEWRFFKPKGTNIKEYRMQIYDLWGNLLWESTKILDGEPVEYWDGLYRNQPVPQGAYVWKAFVKFTNGKVWQGPNGDGNAAGIVTIIR